MNIRDIEEYITEIQGAERSFRNQDKSVPSSATENLIIRLIKQCSCFVLSSLDIIQLAYILWFRREWLKSQRIVYTGLGSCIEVDGTLEDRIVKPLFSDNIIFINSQKNTRIKRINNQRVFNLGSLVKFFSTIGYWSLSKKMKVFKAYSDLNDLILRKLDGNEVYVICLWEMNTLSIMFSKFRSHFTLIKIQHGSMIDYPPYVKPAPIKIADLLYVKNKPTIEFLKKHLCSNYPTEYKLIPYPNTDRRWVSGTHLLYASTIEMNGLHPVFTNFLEMNDDPDLHVIIRLHPREMDKKERFKAALNGYKGVFAFDESKNWLEGNKIRNLIVISPWSSALEEAFDNGFIAITIDPVGKSRFKHFVDNKQFFYTDDLGSTLRLIKTIPAS